MGSWKGWGVTVRFRLFGAFVGLLCAAASPAVAGDGDALVLNVGVYDMMNNPNPTPSFGVEYRPDWTILWKIKPMVGGFVTTDATLYGYAGLLVDFSLGEVFRSGDLDPVYITISAAGGAYSRGDAPKDLGHVFEWRFGGQIGYRFDNGMRLAIALHHLSNAWISEQNPGAEIVTVNLLVPIHRLFGR